MELEEIWLNRLKVYAEQHNCDGVCSWWLRIEYEDLEKNVTTSKINYYLQKSVAKGLLRMEKTRSYTKYYITEKE